MHKFLLRNTFIIFLYMFRAQYAHHQEVKTELYSSWYHHICRWPSGAQVERRCKEAEHGFEGFTRVINHRGQQTC